MTIDRSHHVSRIDDESGVGEARRAAVAMAERAGFNQVDSGKVAIAVTEAAANVLKHGRGGQILLRSIPSGLEMLAIDSGPGIADLHAALADGRSTAGTAGIGFGAISRLASSLEVYTRHEAGTVLAAQFQSSGGEPRSSPAPALELGVALAPYPGEHLCGDAWAIESNRLFLADGLGHGIQACEAATAAVNAFRQHLDQPVATAVEAIHRALRPTRGAAVALAELDAAAHTVRFCGLGNIGASIVEGVQPHGMMSHNGTAGHEVHRISQFDYPWPENALVVLHTDGISARWDLAAYPGLALRHPALVAAVLYRDFRRLRDDAAVLVAGVRARLAREGIA